MASDTSTYLLVSADSTNLPSSRTLEAGTGLSLRDNGVGNPLTLQPVGNLLELANFDTSGYLIYDSSSNTFVDGSFVGSNSINITNTDGTDGNSVFSVEPNSSIQWVSVLNDGTHVSTQSTLNFIPGSNMVITVEDNGLNNRADITFSTTDVASTTATYITQTPNATLTEEQALSTLSTGILKSTTGTGVISIAEPNIDYQVPSANLTFIPQISRSPGKLLRGNGTHFMGVQIGSVGRILQSSGTSYGWSNTVGTVKSVGLTSDGGGLVVIGGSTSPITTSGTYTVNLPTTAVTADSYSSANVTVDTYGRVTTASSGGLLTNWHTITNSSVITYMSPNSGYIINVTSGSCVLNLSTTVVLGDILVVTLEQGGSWYLTGDAVGYSMIYNGNTVSVITGTTIGDSVTLVYVGSNTYIVTSFSGTP